MSSGLLSPRVDAPINWVDPVNWLHPLSRGLSIWLLSVPGAMGGSRWIDLCRNAPGTLTNMEPETDWLDGRGRRGGWGCLNFGGTNEYVDCGRPVITNLIEPFGISAWVRYTSTALMGIAGKGYLGAFPRGHGLYTGGVSGRLAYQVRRNAPVSAVNHTVASNDGLWHHVVGTRINGVTRLYVDRKFSGSDSTAIAIEEDGESQFVVSGRIEPGPAYAFPFTGQIDDVKFWNNRAITLADVEMLYDDDVQYHPGLLSRARVPSVFQAATGNRRRRVIMSRGAA